MPKVVDHDQRRAELVAAAWTVIADEGIEAATIRRIAEVAGCTTGRVTHYFDAKNEILVAALRRVHYAAGARMLGHIRTKRGTEALRAVLLDALPLDNQRGLEWRVWLAFWGRASTDPALIEEQQHRYAEWRRLLQTIIGAIAGERTAPEQVQLLVDLVAGTIDGLGIQAVLEPSRFPAQHLAAAVDALVDIVANRP
jgi:TetR/AcrR family transcriptional regulator, transcriptional repressor of bet genes